MGKYMAKSFHLRSLYQEHGLADHHRIYRLYENLYQYEEKELLLVGKSKIDKEIGHYLNGNQHVFRRFNYETGETFYFYRTNRQLSGQCQKPILIKKNYRLGTRRLNPLNLLKLAKKS